MGSILGFDQFWFLVFIREVGMWDVAHHMSQPGKDPGCLSGRRWHERGSDKCKTKL